MKVRSRIGKNFAFNIGEKIEMTYGENFNSYTMF